MPTNPFSTCIDFSDKRQNATFRDKKGKTSYVFPNQARNNISGLRVDGCILVDDKKCDFLLLNHENDKAWATLIELKGSDLLQAVRQIDATIDKLSGKLKDYKLHGRIVLTKTYAPHLQSSEYLKLRKKLKNIGGSFETGNVQYVEKTIV